MPRLKRETSLSYALKGDRIVISVAMLQKPFKVWSALGGQNVRRKKHKQNNAKTWMPKGFFFCCPFLMMMNLVFQFAFGARCHESIPRSRFSQDMMELATAESAPFWSLAATAK